MIHIVILDDEPDTHLLYRLKFKKLLSHLGEIKLSTFTSAVDCLKFLHEVPSPAVDIILSDINMPEMNGFEFLEKVRKNFNIPVYMISAYESLDFRKKANDLGASRFISKPVDFSTLGRLIAEDLGPV